MSTPAPLKRRMAACMTLEAADDTSEMTLPVSLPPRRKRCPRRKRELCPARELSLPATLAASSSPPRTEPPGVLACVGSTVARRPARRGVTTPPPTALPRCWREVAASGAWSTNVSRSSVRTREQSTATSRQMPTRASALE